MGNIQKSKQVFVGSGSALAANNTAANAVGQFAIVGKDMTALNPAGGDTISTQPSIYLSNILPDGDFKYSSEIKGQSVTSYSGKRYSPSRQAIWAVGYQRGSVVDGVTIAAGGSLVVANSTEYSMAINFLHDKQLYSQRPETLRIVFTSAASATQSNIADQIVNAVNVSGFGSAKNGVKVIKAIKVGNGTGAFGLTSATNFGVELVGLDINQFSNSSYKEVMVNFEVTADNSTGFGASTVTELQKVSRGTGTYTQVYNAENFAQGDEGALNRTKWPTPNYQYLSNSTYRISANVAAATTRPTGNVTATSGSDAITMTSTLGLRGGDLIDVNGVAYVVSRVATATTAVLSTIATATYTGANLKVKYGYNIFNISTQDYTNVPGSGASATSTKSYIIASPSIDSGAADPFDRTLDSADTSAESLDILDILNGWMATTPLAPANATLA
jgi:hypothetical protein